MKSGTTQKEGLRGGKGNFANDPQRASEAGRKGGQNSHMRSDSRRNNSNGATSENWQSRKSAGNEVSEDEE